MQGQSSQQGTCWPVPLQDLPVSTEASRTIIEDLHDFSKGQLELQLAAQILLLEAMACYGIQALNAEALCLYHIAHVQNHLCDGDSEQPENRSPRGASIHAEVITPKDF